MRFTTGMLNREDFEATLKRDAREPVSANVTYKGREARQYATKDFDKIKFPVQKITLKYAEGRLLSLGNGDYVRADKKKVRAP